MARIKLESRETTVTEVRDTVSKESQEKSITHTIDKTVLAEQEEPPRELTITSKWSTRRRERQTQRVKLKQLKRVLNNNKNKDHQENKDTQEEGETTDNTETEDPETNKPLVKVKKRKKVRTLKPLKKVKPRRSQLKMLRRKRDQIEEETKLLRKKKSRDTLLRNSRLNKELSKPT